MSENVQMPALGESVTEGTVTRWLKSVGDTVEVDEPLLEVSTDKVDTEIPSPVAGVLEKILVEEDETVEVGANLAVIGSGEGGGDAAPAQDEAPAEQEAPAEEPAAEEQPQQEQEQQQAPAADAAPASGGGGGGEEIKLPALGESVTEGTVTRWLKSVGDTVEVDEPLLEVSTDKVDTEVPSPVAGTVQQILVEEDETVEVGAVLAIVGSGAAPAEQAPAPEQPEQPEQSEPEQPKQAEPAAPAKAETPASEADVPAQAAQEAPSTTSAPEPKQAEQKQAAPSAPGATPAPAAKAGGTYLTPLVRKLAADKGVDLASVTGTGVGGRIRKEDVLEAARQAEAASTSAAAPAAPAAESAPKKPSVPAISPLRGTTEKTSRLRKLVASRMVEALSTQAQLTTAVEVDVTRVAALRNRAKADFKAREGANLTFLPFFTLAAVEALKAYPKINATFAEDEITYHGQENVGIAVDTERGLVVPVIKDAGDLNLAGVARKIADLGARTRANKVGPDELAGATFTITNTGSGGAVFDTPIVPVGQVAILGTGTITKRAAVVTDADGNDTIGIRSTCFIFLSYDHRLVDGADAARFLTAIKNRIEEGAFEAEVGL
ncbi:2-oxoglutarate dehydrogenase, E2 component, dihydrolipoamide succinyltransferase [Cellulosimicrobium marinum]|uniref:2-oxoglutarate dehydrogenase, E2 component, dihydrolipoamide succinyltransferase n=1 Tax=Cellulosimicrobium marinum TaxID=1638992 RepID=UPI001E3C9EA5|nr:2-oxoglutarate dehydrogenase, E2 component, dihydrolipoamide succinyltransferase [Cellulosimicrobium marinum]MCB7135488.1 2-oxoglutarate dehydrogenase, E2 component, dihydrolipoamide succinyltransferase [Cellulosimicrobium marinum]